MTGERVVVIGGGHNGLVAAAYLARAGKTVTLVEARERLGGVVGSFEYLPGYRASVTNSPGSLEPRVVEELELERHGLRFHRPEITVSQRFGAGTFVGYRDRARIAQQIDAFAPGEYARYRDLIDRLNRLGAASGLSLWAKPDDVDVVASRLSGADRDLFEQIIGGSLSELLDTSLRSEQAKALLLMIALPGTLLSPRSPGSAIGLLLRPISMASALEANPDAASAQPLRGSVGLPIGSMSAIVDALVASATEAGATLLTGRRVVRVTKRDGAASGVELDDGTTLPADAVISTIEPSLLQHSLLEDPDDLSAASTITPPTGGAFKVALALDALPEVPGVHPDEQRAVLSSQIRIAPSADYVEAAIDDALQGRPSEAPIMWALIPSLTSPGLAPEGRHLMSVNVWHAPHALGEEYWRSNRDSYGEKVVDALDAGLPGLRSCITDARFLSPVDIEREFALTGSNITHGDITAERLIGNRPTPDLADGKAALPGLYLGGSSVWPGGYVTGVPGRNAARAVIDECAPVPSRRTASALR